MKGVNKPLAVGDRLVDRFALEEHLGTGATGAVFRALDEFLGETVCVKILHDHRHEVHDVVARFKRELTLMRRINAPGVCRAFDLREHQGEHFLVLEYIEGERLDRLLGRDKLDVGRVIHIMRQVASAIAAAHEAGVVHRDIKPENIMVRDDGNAVVLDFGIALATDLERLTKGGFVLGSVAYLSPGIVRGDQPSPASDVWSLGVMLYFMLAGRLPFEGKSAAAVASAVLSETPPSPRRFNSAVPPALAAIVRRALARDPRARYASAVEMSDELEALMDSARRTPVTSHTAIVPRDVTLAAPPDDTVDTLDTLEEATVFLVRTRDLLPLSDESVTIPPQRALIVHRASFGERASLQVRSTLGKGLLFAGAAAALALCAASFMLQLERTDQVVEVEVELPAPPALTPAAAEAVPPPPPDEVKPAAAPAPAPAKPKVRPDPTRALRELRADVTQAAKARGVREGDLPAFDRLMSRADAATKRRRYRDANRELRRARALVERQRVDTAFVAAKLLRFNNAFDRASPQIQERLEPQAIRVATLVDGGAAKKANLALNSAFSQLEKQR